MGARDWLKGGKGWAKGGLKSLLKSELKGCGRKRGQGRETQRGHGQAQLMNLDDALTLAFRSGFQCLG